MFAFERKLPIRQFPAAKRRQVRRTELRKLVQQLGETFALTLPDLRKPPVCAPVS